MQIEIKVTLSADAALLAALQGLISGSQPSGTTTQLPGKTAKEKAKPVDLVTTPAATTESLSEKPVTTESLPAVQVETTHTMESLKAIAVPKSKAGKKDEIRAKLTEMGYPGGLADLQPKDFNAFHDYIVSL